ncbi:CC0125/CC1285 family lipoprotein [Pikeienuella sp. HZG-20]|uniref:CC0125/CC1285 family lipoprotein n=1 Tax=Paludibacillus litoralis TaxID=3133267 RepID=UPI0030EF69F8
MVSKRTVIGMLCAAGAAVSLMACAAPTPYEPAAPGVVGAEGFSEMELEPGRYRVTFTGNSVTSREEVETGVLLRAAEVTLAAGGDWFQVVREDTETDTQRVTVGAGPYPYGVYGRRFGFSTFDTFETREIKRYQTIAEIMVMTGEKPAGAPEAYDARAVVAALGPRVRRPETN